MMSAPDRPTVPLGWCAVISLAFLALVLHRIGLPSQLYFDEVHYVPAARQMLEPVMPQPMLNPMHPPLAKQLIALSIHSFGDGPLGWRCSRRKGRRLQRACSLFSTRCCSCNRGSRCWIFSR